MPGPVTEHGDQHVTLEFEIDAAFVSGNLEVYRDLSGADPDPDSPTSVKVATLTTQDGTAAQADTGSGVVSTLQFSAEDACVPLGSWQWDVFSGGDSVWCEMSATIETANPACTGVGGGGAGGNGAAGEAAQDVDVPEDVVVVQDCSVRSAPQSGAAGAAWLGLALGLGLGLRRRRR